MIIGTSWRSFIIVSRHSIVPNIGPWVRGFIQTLMNYFENMEVVILAKSLVYPPKEVIAPHISIMKSHQPIVPVTTVC